MVDSMEKNDLFTTVIKDGSLPRKTFSMGEAADKRFYLNVRKSDNKKCAVILFDRTFFIFSCLLYDK